MRFDAGRRVQRDTYVIINPGSSSPYATGAGDHTCDGRDYIDASGNAPESQCTGPQTTNVAIPAAERKFHGVELVVKKRVSDALWAQASYLWSHVYGNYDGEASIGESRTPAAARGSQHQRRLRLPGFPATRRATSSWNRGIPSGSTWRTPLPSG